jgi:PIN domain nuclease of toxin-antitoxin system
LIWYLEDSPRLSGAAGRAFADCEADNCRTLIPSICAVELVYLTERGRIPPTVLQSLLEELAASQSLLQLVLLDLAIVLALSRIPRSAIPEMPDRIVAATASALRLPLVTRDRAIQAAGVDTIW